MLASLHPDLPTLALGAIIIIKLRRDDWTRPRGRGRGGRGGGGVVYLFTGRGKGNVNNDKRKGCAEHVHARSVFAPPPRVGGIVPADAKRVRGRGIFKDTSIPSSPGLWRCGRLGRGSHS